ncbi:TatD family hydrolase [Clostridium sp. BNL1100]|uniref:TatD family hydrolase n=1 Tax=Clostridium sp. BNL1100 TaxID=755731 RepID=UPI00024A7F37|nr:TatD family hydrolase [Clostridium sp. BNL1100]AEY65840.1 Mg-dependent DNase [Clostridium sp. BNL1100]
MAFIDFHVHIDFYDNPWKIINAYEDRGIYALFVTNLPEIYEKHLANYGNFKYVKLALGYHPEIISEYPLNEECFYKNLRYTNYIGEVGLDFTGCNELDKKKQVQYFKSICEIVKGKSKILSIHSRKAENIVLQILKDNDIEFAVFHWYSGSISLIKSIIDNGYYFSVNYGMLNSKSGRNILSHIPKNKILFETDGPFIRKDKKVVSPDDIPQIYKEFNEFYGINDFGDIVYYNFKKLLHDRMIKETKSKFLIEN